MTWLLVSTSPSALITMPVPAAASLSYWSVVLMITRPGLTLVTMSCSPRGSRGNRGGYCAASWQGTARAAGSRVVELQQEACRECRPDHQHDDVRQHVATPAPEGSPESAVIPYLNHPTQPWLLPVHPTKPPGGRRSRHSRHWPALCVDVVWGGSAGQAGPPSRTAEASPSAGTVNFRPPRTDPGTARWNPPRCPLRRYPRSSASRRHCGRAAWPPRADGPPSSL